MPARSGPGAQARQEQVEQARCLCTGVIGITPSQLGLAWLLQHDPSILVIPGTSSVAHLEENLAAGDIELPPGIAAELDALAEHDAHQEAALSTVRDGIATAG